MVMQKAPQFDIDDSSTILSASSGSRHAARLASVGDACSDGCSRSAPSGGSRNAARPAAVAAAEVRRGRARRVPEFVVSRLELIDVGEFIGLQDLFVNEHLAFTRHVYEKVTLRDWQLSLLCPAHILDESGGRERHVKHMIKRDEDCFQGLTILKAISRPSGGAPTMVGYIIFQVREQDRRKRRRKTKAGAGSSGSSEPWVLVKQIFVRHAVRHRGCGKLLFTSMLKALEGKEQEDIRLSVLDLNTTATQWYRSQGFMVVNLSQELIGLRDDANVIVYQEMRRLEGNRRAEKAASPKPDAQEPASGCREPREAQQQGAKRRPAASGGAKEPEHRRHRGQHDRQARDRREAARWIICSNPDECPDVSKMLIAHATTLTQLERVWSVMRSRDSCSNTFQFRHLLKGKGPRNTWPCFLLYSQRGSERGAPEHLVHAAMVVHLVALERGVRWAQVVQMAAVTRRHGLNSQIWQLAARPLRDLGVGSVRVVAQLGTEAFWKDRGFTRVFKIPKGIRSALIMDRHLWSSGGLRERPLLECSLQDHGRQPPGADEGGGGQGASLDLKEEAPARAPCSPETPSVSQSETEVIESNNLQVEAFTSGGLPQGCPAGAFHQAVPETPAVCARGARSALPGAPAACARGSSCGHGDTRRLRWAGEFDGVTEMPASSSTALDDSQVAPAEQAGLKGEAPPDTGRAPMAAFDRSLRAANGARVPMPLSPQLAQPPAPTSPPGAAPALVPAFHMANTSTAEPVQPWEFPELPKLPFPLTYARLRCGPEVYIWDMQTGRVLFALASTPQPLAAPPQAPRPQGCSGAGGEGDEAGGGSSLQGSTAALAAPATGVIGAHGAAKLQEMTQW